MVAFKTVPLILLSLFNGPQAPCSSAVLDERLYDRFDCYFAMAANFWSSTQRRYWQFSKEQLVFIRDKLDSEDKALVQQCPLPDRRLLSNFFNTRRGSPSLKGLFLTLLH